VYLRHLLEWESIICYVLICALIFLKILSLILDSRIKPYFYGTLTTIHSFCKKRAVLHGHPPYVSSHHLRFTVTPSGSIRRRRPPATEAPPPRHQPATGPLPPHSWSFHRNSSPLPSKNQDSNLNRVAASHRITTALRHRTSTASTVSIYCLDDHAIWAGPVN
jgi:hypothetical protein